MRRSVDADDGPEHRPAVIQVQSFMGRPRKVYDALRARGATLNQLRCRAVPIL
jgi:hypothetical protein